MRTTIVELVPAQVRPGCVATWVVAESDGYVTADARVYLDSSPKSDEATPSVPPALPGVIFDVLDVDSDARETEICQTSICQTSSIFVPLSEKTSCSFNKSTTSFLLTVCLMPGRISTSATPLEQSR